jgi:hypothetical protein
MAVDLFDLVEPLRREVNPPGSNAFPDATDDDYSGYLADGFWEARLDGFLAGYEESDGIVTPISGTDDLGRDWQQLIVIYAGFRILKNALRQMRTVFRAQAGPVSFETQQSAQLLREIMIELRERRDWLLDNLASTGQVPAYYIDAVVARHDSLYFGDTTWVGF